MENGFSGLSKSECDKTCFNFNRLTKLEKNLISLYPAVKINWKCNQPRSSTWSKRPRCYLDRYGLHVSPKRNPETSASWTHFELLGIKRCPLMEICFYFLFLIIQLDERATTTLTALIYFYNTCLYLAQLIQKNYPNFGWKMFHHNC